MRKGARPQQCRTFHWPWLADTVFRINTPSTARPGPGPPAKIVLANNLSSVVVVAETFYNH